jgi:tRNA(Ile)-lysidine synthase
MGFSPDSLLDVLRRLPSPSRYRVAYSGGLDSSVLLHAMAALRPALSAPVSALHLDHALQAESAQWTQHCQEQCAGVGVSLQTCLLTVNTDTGSSLEAEARAARLGAFRAEMAPGEMLLTAQHQDDQAETLLLQLLRGSGPSGLAAMPALSDFAGGWLARPLLDFTRQQLEAYARRQGVAWVQDPSNAKCDFDRNYLRHRVLPRLRKRWPSCAKTLSRSASLCAEAQDLNELLAQREMAQVQGRLPGSLSVRGLVQREAGLRRAVLRRWIKDGGFAMPSRRKLMALDNDALHAAAERSPLVSWGDAQVRRYRDDLLLMPALPPLPEPSVLLWRSAAALVLPLGLGVLRLAASETNPEHDGEPFKRPLTVRFGAYRGVCRVRGNAHHKPLKKLYQERGVPTWVRPYVPLVFSDETLLSVGGCWQCESSDAQTASFRCLWEGHPFARFLPAEGARSCA